MDIGRTIRNLRTRKGWKAGAFAERLGVSKSYISRIEREHRRINTDLLDRIAKALEVPPAVLLGGQEEEAWTLREETEAVYQLLLEDRVFNPRFVDASVAWLAEVVFPRHEPFASAAGWEEQVLETVGGEDEAFRRLLGRFREDHADILPLNPRPQIPYARFRESAQTALRGLSGREKTDLVSRLFPALLRTRHRWPPAMQGIPCLVPKPGEQVGVAVGTLRLPEMQLDGKETPEPSMVEILPGEGSEHLRAVVIADSSMAPKYEPGDVVVFDMARRARSGERSVVAVKDGRWGCRIHRRRGPLVQFTPLNPLYEPWFLKPEEILWLHPVVRSFSD